MAMSLSCTIVPVSSFWGHAKTPKQTFGNFAAAHTGTPLCQKSCRIWLPRCFYSKKTPFRPLFGAVGGGQFPIFLV